MQKGRYRTKDGKAQIEWELTQKENGLEFSASGGYDGGSGQNIDTIAAAYPDDSMVQRIAKVWERWHLNGMRSGTREQEAEVDRRRMIAEDYARQQDDAAKHFYDSELKQANWHSLCGKFGHASYYGWECAVLREAGLYEVSLPEGLKATGGFPDEVVSGERGYRFGEHWVFEEIPADVIAEIESWSNAPQPTESLHEAKAQAFLADNGLKFRATLSDSKPAPWEPSGHHYRVTLSKRAHGRSYDNQAKRLTFDFWGSRADLEAGQQTVTPYDVLSCIASDSHTPETFADFCDEYGYDVDSIKAAQTFKRADRFARRLREFFTEAELEQLQEIR